MKATVLIVARRARAALGAGCGEKAEPTGREPGAPRAVHGDARLPPERRPRRALRGAGDRRLTQGGARREAPAAAGPGGAAEAARAGPGRPGDLLRARAAARARRRARTTSSSVGALVQKPLTSLIVAAEGRRHDARRPGRQARRHGRHPVPARLPEDDPDQTPAWTRARVKETNVGFNLVPAMLSKRVDATLGAFWNYEGVDLQRAGRKPGDPAHGAARRADLRRARSSSPAARTSTPPAPRGCGASCPATAAGHRLLRDNPHGRRRRAAEGRQGPRPRSCSEASIKATLPVFFPADADASRGAGRSRSTGPTTSAGCARTNLLKRPPSEAPPLTNEFLPGRGAGESSRTRMRYCAAMPG